MSGLYTFKEQDAWDFGRQIGQQPKPRGKELQFKYCPYCNGGSSKDKGSFSINKDNGQFKCLRSTCGKQGNFITLARDFGISLGYDFDAYYSNKKKFYQFDKNKVIEVKEPAIKYMESRAISEGITRKYEITTQKGHDNILVFPFKDEDNQIQFIKYRKTDFDKERDGNYKEWAYAKKDSNGNVIESCKPILFGMNHCNFTNEALILTEGQIDSLSVATSGFENAVSVPTGARGFTWFPYCWDFLRKFKTLIIFGDFENGEISLLAEMRKRFQGVVKNVRPDDYKDCKDANEILRKYGVNQVKKCIENAVAQPVHRVIKLEDVKRIDIFDIPKLPTTICKVDRLLYGGLPFGGLHLITGKPGEGKSTLASQMLIKAIDNGYNVFAYSGELPNYMFKAWMEFQMAGPNHIIMNRDGFGDPHFLVSKPFQSLMERWYSDKMYLYDNSIIELDEKEDICRTIEESILRYDTKVVLIDNLMTALDLDEEPGTDKYDKQSKFVKKLARIALKYDALIILVAHKRKNNFSTNANDEVAGAGDITNLAQITISYEKGGEDLPQEMRLVKVAKNRLFGNTCLSGYELSYDAASKRIYGEDDDLAVAYGWEQKLDSFIPMQDNEPTPFD